MKRQPHILVAVPESYRPDLATMFYTQSVNVIMAENIAEAQNIIETQNISGVIIDNRWLNLALQAQNDLFSSLQIRLIPTVTLIAQGGNKEIARWFHPLHHQYLPLPFTFDELRAMIKRAKIQLEYQNTHTVIFLWDKDRATTAMFKLFFREKGYNTLLVHSLTELKRVIYHVDRPVLITKTNLDTNEDIIALWKDLRGDEQTKNIPIIAGYAEGKMKDEALSAQVNGYFGRVFDIEGILQMIQQLERDPSIMDIADQ